MVCDQFPEPSDLLSHLVSHRHRAAWAEELALTRDLAAERAPGSALDKLFYRHLNRGVPIVTISFFGNLIKPFQEIFLRS